jgi:hypothetical protein
VESGGSIRLQVVEVLGGDREAPAPFRREDFQFAGLEAGLALDQVFEACVGRLS